MMSRWFGPLFFILVLISPFWGLASYVREWTLPDIGLLIPVLIFTAHQAFWSALGALLLGFCASLGYLTLTEDRARRFYRRVVLFFSALPALFWITAVFWWSQKLGWLPEGLVPIVICHSFLNFGLVTLGSERIIALRIGQLAETSQTLGVRPWRFWFQVAGPLIWKEHLLLGIVIFSLCFSSLSIPLIFSRPHEPTLEVLIARWALREGQWGAALSLGLLQWLMIALISWSVLPSSLAGRWGRQDWGFWIRKEFRLTLILPSLLVAIAYFGFIKSLFDPQFWQNFLTHFSALAFFGSIALGMGVMLGTVLLFLLFSLSGPSALLQSFLRSYSAPSTAIVALCFIMLPGEHPLLELVKTGLGCVLLSFPVLYRTVIDADWNLFKNQWISARILGASSWLIVRDVWWPQARPMLSVAVGLAVLWSVSDFALSGLILERPLALALLAETSLNSYNVELGQAYTLLCLMLGIAFYVFFEWTGRAKSTEGE